MRVMGPFCGRRSHVAVIIVISLVVIFGITAVAIDLSWLVAAKRQLQVTSDNTALATAKFVVDNYPADQSAIKAAGAAFMQTENPVEHMLLTPDHVETALATINNGRVTAITFVDQGYNAVYVDVTMANENPTLPAFFGNFLGYDEYQPYAQSLVLIKPPTAPDLIPFTINWDEWHYQTDCCDAPPNGDESECCYFEGQEEPCCIDDWTWSEASGVAGQGDGIHEAIIYPLPSGHPCPGNFGALGNGFGCPPNVPCMRDLIDNGISPEQMEEAFGTPNPIFPNFDPGYYVSGTPGDMGGAFQANLEDRIGDIVGVFLHRNCELGGNNTLYNIVDLAYGRIMFVKLTGQGQGLILQPVDLDEEEFPPKVIGLAL